MLSHKMVYVCSFVIENYGIVMYLHELAHYLRRISKNDQESNISACIDSYTTLNQTNII